MLHAFLTGLQTMTALLLSSAWSAVDAATWGAGIRRQKTKGHGQFWVRSEPRTLMYPNCLVSLQRLDIWQGIPMNFKPYFRRPRCWIIVVAAPAARDATGNSAEPIGRVARRRAPKVLHGTTARHQRRRLSPPLRKIPIRPSLNTAIMLFSVIAGLP